MFLNLQFWKVFGFAAGGRKGAKQGHSHDGGAGPPLQGRGVRHASNSHKTHTQDDTHSSLQGFRLS